MKFDTPIYLAPGQEYAMVLLAPNTDQYEVWTAQMGEKTIETANLPDSEAILYSRQFALGSLFKSQNGSIWTAAQESDLKFQLYKAKFTSNTGIAHFGNPPLDSSNGYVPTLQENAITVLPKNVTLGITTILSTDGLVGILTAGRRIAGAGTSVGTIVSTGSSVSSITTTAAGLNYNTGTRSTTNVFGSGSGLTLNVSGVDASGTITGISVVSAGTGYNSGDIVALTNTGSQTGRDAVITVTASGNIDTLRLTNVQGSIPTGDLVYYNNSNVKVSLANTDVLSATEEGGIYSGNYLQVQHFNHGMYANNNKLKLDDVVSDTSPTTLTSQLLVTTGASGVIQVEDSTIFETFEGQSVSVTNIGYVKIGDEIIGYTAASSNQLTISARAVEGIAETHEIGDRVMKYELNGISLRRINNVVYDISDTGIESNSYYVEVDRGATSTIEGKSIGLNRATDTASYPQVSFTNELIGGGRKIKASENIIFNRINPRFNILSPGRQTSVSANIRTTSGTSMDGSEVSFNLQNTLDIVTPNQENDLDSVRMVCSRVNELNQSAFNNVSGKRSFNSTVTLNTTNENLSPMIFLDDSAIEFISDNINSPVTNYATDSSTNSINNDPHEAVYVSNTINLAQPASSLKVILTAYRPNPADIRVLYSLIRDDSTEVEQEFELFPGFDNLELTSEGSLKVVNESLNDGKPDVRVPASEKGQYLEYEFTANDLEDFSGYRIKVVMSSTDQANYPIIRDLRTLALK